MLKDFCIRDLYLASYLFSLGVTPTLKKEDREILFSFPSSPDLDTLIKNYHSNVSIHIGDYVRAIKTLRGRMNDLKYAAGGLTC
jgi:hypothetical protein